MTPPNNRREWIAASVLIAGVSALCYLLLAHRFGFYFDDWYLAYAGYVKGSEQFAEVFASDRPFRAYFVGAVFDLFGLRAPLYSYLSYVLRAAGAVGMFWLLRLLWPRQARFAVPLAVLFAIYPGWTDQPAAFDYQSHLLSFALLVFSLALSVYAAQRPWGWKKLALIAPAVGMQIAALLLMEYYIGLEGLRLVLILFLAFTPQIQRRSWRGWPAALRQAGLNWLPYLAGALGFFYWRAFLFTSARAATDIGDMFAGLLANPALRGLNMLADLFYDFFSVTLLAWLVPFYQQTNGLRLRDSLIAAAVGAAAAALVYIGWRWVERAARREAPAAPEECPRDGVEMVLIGSLGVIFSLIPVALGERHVIFFTFSRFSLPGSIGAVMVIGGLLVAFARRPLQVIVPLALIFMAGAFHYANSVQFAGQWESMRNFWWQVSWRAPQIAPETVLAVEYAGAPIMEDYFVWGPANLIYYPEAHEKEGKVFTPLGAVVLTDDAVVDITLRRERTARERRSLLTPQHLGNVLVIEMSSAGSCARVLDGRAPELSEITAHRIARIAPYSRIEAIQTGAEPRVPPADLFGPEPEHDFCYYYQKASLARQRGDWEEVVRLGDMAEAEGHRPSDWVDWMPFLQGYAYLGRYDKVDAIAALYRGVPFLHDQACYRFREDAYRYGQMFPEGQAYLNARFCE